MKKYYLSLHGKESKECEDAARLKKMLDRWSIKRTKNPYEANIIIALFYGEMRSNARDYACEVRVLELIHKKNSKAQFFVLGPITEIVNFPSLYPFLSDLTNGKTLAGFAGGGQKGLSSEAGNEFKEQITEILVNTEVPKILNLPETADALEEAVVNWVAIDDVINRKGLRLKDAQGFDEELSFNLAYFVDTLAREMIRAYKGELKPIKGLSHKKIERLAKAYFK